MSLKQKTISGLSWTFADKFSSQIIQFVFGIILARLLTPQEYGLTGLVAIFLTISNVFISSGFSEGLIRKTDATRDDFSTVYVFNILVGIVCYVLIVLSSNSISHFFNEPALKNIIIVLSFTLVINSFGLIPRVYLLKKMDFRALTIISIITTVISGSAAIILAFCNYGVWSLVWRSIITSFVGTLMLYLFSRVRLPIYFSIKSFKELFGFSSKLLLTELISQIYNSIYYLIIGKFFSARDLGLYTRADNYKDLPSRTIDTTIQTVSYPVLAQVRNEPERFKENFRKLLITTTFITSILMFGMSAASNNFILGLIGNKWLESIPYLRLLCFVGMFYPIISMNMNVLNLMGRSDLFLKAEIIKKILAVPVIIIGILIGIKAMILGVIILTLFGFGIHMYFTSKLIDYKAKDQLRDLLPNFVIGAFVWAVVYLLNQILPFSSLPLLFFQVIIGSFCVYLVSQVLKLKGYLFLLQGVKIWLKDGK
jgi:teichuronic acid exporter